MRGSSKTLTNKGLLLTLIGIIAATILSIFLDIPVLRQLLGVIFLAFIPGLLILHILKLNKLGLAEGVVLTVGISIAFLMFFGYFLNQASLLFGYTSPLSTSFLTIALGITLVALLIAAYLRNKEAFSFSLFRLELNTRAKLCLLLPVTFPLMSIVGTRILNTTDNNAILLALLFLIPLSIILIVWQRREISRDTYPVAIVLISVSLLMYYWLSSEHILGHDVHYEYYFFRMTLLNSHWSIIERSTLDSCLSISLLPAMFQSLLDVNASEQLFKGVYVLICAFTPLSIYIISRKYLGELYALFAAFFFISHVVFLSAPGSPRTNLAIFFFALYCVVLLHPSIRGATQKGLMLVFMLAILGSHYSTAYIFLLLLVASYLLGLVFRKYIVRRGITITSVGLLFITLFFWYGQIVQAPFRSGVRFIQITIKNLAIFAAEEARAAEVSLIIAKGMIEKPFLSWINLVITWATFILIAVGVITTLIKRKEMLAAQGENLSPRFLAARINFDFFAMSIICSVMLVAFIALPYVSIGYGMSRIYSQLIVILSSFFVLGGIILAGYLKRSPPLLILLILLPYSIFATGVIYEASGIHGILTLSSETPSYYSEFVQDQEAHSARWLKEYGGEDSQIYVADSSVNKKLTSQGPFSPKRISGINIIDQPKEEKAYLYLSYNNVIKGIWGAGEYAFYDWGNFISALSSYDKVYANGGSEIWR